MKKEGNILKMISELKTPVNYSLPMGDENIPMNPLIGRPIQLTFDGRINDIHTGKRIKKSYNQGYSYESFTTLARCDMCILKPELCHFHKGTCREPDWGEANCMIPHYVYLSNTSGVKVGITRENQIPTRWIDQGAAYALPILKVKNRLVSGQLEVEIKKELPDKTNWRKMLKGESDFVDLKEIRDRMFDLFGREIDRYEAEDIECEQTVISYPVANYPSKPTPLSFDKNKVIEGVLRGIRGQYLLFDHGVLNMRKHQGYYLGLST